MVMLAGRLGTLATSTQAGDRLANGKDLYSAWCANYRGRTLATDLPTTSIHHPGIGDRKDRAALVEYIATMKAN